MRYCNENGWFNACIRDAYFMQISILHANLTKYVDLKQKNEDLNDLIFMID